MLCNEVMWREAGEVEEVNCFFLFLKFTLLDMYAHNMEHFKFYGASVSWYIFLVTNNAYTNYSHFTFLCSPSIHLMSCNILHGKFCNNATFKK